MFDIETRLLELTRKQELWSVADLERLLIADDLKVRLENLHERRMLTLSNWAIEQSPLQRILLAEDLIICGCDPQKVARILGWQEFENFVRLAFEESGFRALKHLIIKLGLRTRCEIDVLAWNQSLTLAIDCKHWVKGGMSQPRLRKAAEAQAKRVTALARRPEILCRSGLEDLEKRSIMPILLGLRESETRESNGVPIVPISKLADFLSELSPFETAFRLIPVRSDGQTRLGHAGILT